MARAVFGLPVFVIVGVAGPFFQQAIVIGGVATDLSQRAKAVGASGSADAIAFMKEAQSGIDHVLCCEVRWLGDSEEVLYVASLRTAERADFSGAEGLRSEPFAEVVAVAVFSPAECAIANPCPFGSPCAAVVDHGDDIAATGKAGGGAAGTFTANVGVALFEEDWPGAFTGRKVQVCGELCAVAHGDQLMLFANGRKIERRQILSECCRSRQKQKNDEQQVFHGMPLG